MTKFSIKVHSLSDDVFDIVYTDRDENSATHPVYLVRIDTDTIRLHPNADQAERNRLHAPSGLIFDENGRIVVAE